MAPGWDLLPATYYLSAPGAALSAPRPGSSAPLCVGDFSFSIVFFFVGKLIHPPPPHSLPASPLPVFVDTRPGGDELTHSPRVLSSPSSPQILFFPLAAAVISYFFLDVFSFLACNTKCKQQTACKVWSSGIVTGCRYWCVFADDAPAVAQSSGVKLLVRRGGGGVGGRLAVQSSLSCRTSHQVSERPRTSEWWLQR